MARRHASLIPLSRDHYEGLLLAHQLREPQRPMMSQWPDEETGRARFVARFYHEHLERHFLAEEESLFPLVVKHVPDAKPLVDDLLVEHRQIKQLVLDCEHSDPDRIRPLLARLSELLEKHIRKEERKLFPQFEQHAPAEVLAAAEQQVGQHYPDKTTPSTPHA